MRTILGGILRELGFEVVEAANGEEALDSVRTHDDLDLALVDWNMPVMTGLDFVNAVRADARGADLRLMMVTTETEINRMSLALEAGADEYIMKPFTKDMLLEKLKMIGFELDV